MTDDDRSDPLLPCPYPPGSEGKVRVLEERFRRGLPLFQKGDAPQRPFGCGLFDKAEQLCDLRVAEKLQAEYQARCQRVTERAAERAKLSAELLARRQRGAELRAKLRLRRQGPWPWGQPA